MSFAALPVEILDEILTHVQPAELQRTSLNLLRAIPNSAISLSNLVRHLSLSREGQTDQLYQFLRKIERNEIKDREIVGGSEGGNGLRDAVRSIELKAWRAESQTVVDLFKTFNELFCLKMTIGPLFTPDVMLELMQPAWRGKIEEITFRFNPYVSEKSYFSFLKGSYFDCIPLEMNKWSTPGALKRLRFVQDWSPMHNVEVASIPAWGFRSGGDGESSLVMVPTRRIDQVIDPRAFAQPIVFFRLQNLASCALSPAGSTIESLVLQLPRRDLLPALTAFQLTTSLPLTPFSPFPALKHLNLSTSHFISYERLSLLLRLYPRLESLTLDRCSGLVQDREKDESSGLAIIKNWLARSIGGQGASRAQDAERGWKSLVKDRPTGVPAPGPNGVVLPPILIGKPKRKTGRSGYGNMRKAEVEETVEPIIEYDPNAPILQVKDIIILPAVNSLRAIGFGIFDLDERVTQLWQMNWTEGYQESKGKGLEKMRAGIKRWDLWASTGKLDDGDRRLVAFKDSLDESCLMDLVEEEDEIFRAFLLQKGLVVINPEVARSILVRMEQMDCVFCTVADCSGAAGISHYSLLEKNDLVEREAREKLLWEEEDSARESWRRPAEEHCPGCAHLISRKEFNE